MKSPSAVPCTTEQTKLGEGVRWDTRRDELLRLDIEAGIVYRDRVEVGGGLTPVRSYIVDNPVGAVAPIHGDDGWLLAAGRGILHLAPDGSTTTVAADLASPGTRMNDAACDPQGRFWAGTMAEDHHSGAGALYRMDGNGRIDRVLDGLTISNGLGWSPDGTTMYLADSGPRVILAFDFDGESGTLSGERTLVTMNEDLGAPDGLTVDGEGDLWVAVYGGGRVRRYTPDGALRLELTVPARQTTCCAFAGPGMSRLYITTATEGWTDEQRRADPAAGVVYRIDTDATGVPAARFVPQRRWWTEVGAVAP